MIKILSLTSWRRFAQGGFLALGMVATGGAWAQTSQCDVTLSSILPSNQAVLKADCGTSLMSQITWTRDVGSVSPAPVVYGPFTISPATLADINFTTLLISGTHSYTASGLAGATIVPAGKAAVVTLAQPILNVAVTLGGSVTSAPKSTVPPLGIDACTSSSGVCTASFDSGTAVVLTATPANNTFSFSSWGGDCSGIIGNICTVSMTTLRTVTASFSTVPTYTLNVTSSGGIVSGSAGATTINCNGGSGTCIANNLVSGTAVSLTATPAAGNVFNGWSGACSNSSGACSFNIGTANATVTANFSQAPTYNLTVTSAGGTVSGTAGSTAISCSNGSGTCSATGLASGAQVSLTATPTGSNAFNGWSGACTNSTGACTFSISSNASVTANFGPVGSFTLNVTSSGGTVSGTAGSTAINCNNGGGTCSATGLASGAQVNLTATPTGSNAFNGWSGACTNSSGGCSFNITANASVTASFSTPPPPGSVCGTADKVWNLQTTGLFPMPPATTSSAGGYAIQFVADGATFPYGVFLSMLDESGIPQPKDVVISTCAHDFNPVGGNNACAKVGMTAAFDLLYMPSPAQPAATDCQLLSGSTYYINFRPSDLATRAAAQFAATLRTAPPPPPTR